MAKGACVLCGKVWSRETRKARLTAAGDVYLVFVPYGSGDSVLGVEYRMVVPPDKVVCILHNESCARRSNFTRVPSMRLVGRSEAMDRLRKLGCAFKAVSV